ncbi:MAG: hypothetical protein AB7E85_03280 [Pseudobdellovibrionaceae bacterium]
MRLIPNPRVPEFYEAFTYAAIDAACQTGKRLEPDYKVTLQKFYFITTDELNDLRRLIRTLPTFGDPKGLEDIINGKTTWRAQTRSWIYPFTEEDQRILKSFPEKLMSEDNGEMYRPKNIEKLISALKTFSSEHLHLASGLERELPFSQKIAEIRSFMETREEFLLPVETACFREVTDEEIDIWGEFGTPLTQCGWVETEEEKQGADEADDDVNPSGPTTNLSPS